MGGGILGVGGGREFAPCGERRGAGARFVYKHLPPRSAPWRARQKNPRARQNSAAWGGGGTGGSGAVLTVSPPPIPPSQPPPGAMAGAGAVRDAEPNALRGCGGAVSCGAPPGNSTARWEPRGSGEWGGSTNWGGGHNDPLCDPVLIWGVGEIPVILC